MALFDQPKTSYSATTNAVRIISDAIKLIDPMDTPLLVALGGFDAARDKFDIRGNGTKIEWLEDQYNPVTDTANQGTTITTNTTTLTVTDASIFQPASGLEQDRGLAARRLEHRVGRRSDHPARDEASDRSGREERPPRLPR